MRKFIPVLNICILILGLFFFNADYIPHFYYILFGLPLVVALASIYQNLKIRNKCYYNIFTTNENYSKITLMIFGIMILIVCGICYKFSQIKLDYLILGSLLGIAYVIISLIYQPDLSLKKSESFILIKYKKEEKKIKFDQITKFELLNSELVLETANNKTIKYQNLELSEKDKLFLTSILSK